MLNRRALLLSGLSASPLQGLAQPPRAPTEPMRCGVDSALHDSGLAQALQRGFATDTGLLVKLVPAAASSVLQALERGDVEAALCNSPLAEAQLEALGFAHDRVTVAASEFVIVGPLRQAGAQAKPAQAPKSAGSSQPATPGRPPAARDPARLFGAGSVAQALQRLVEASAADNSIHFLSPNDGSGTHACEQALWRAAKLAPAGAWYRQAGAESGFVKQARDQGDYALVEAGAWGARGGAPLAVLVQGDPLLRVPVHLMRSFRSKHKVAKLFSTWVSGPKGRSVVAAQRGYRLPAL
ncbi:MAG: substrate-binding domain-containing protein [Burkholderiales bacterium]|jgi:tungstate transport system substrate-binding protein|nr:substrate-binding domain-containing protein [Burkholderiales bacterium]